ncbi:MAG: restriction endonuclease subunit S [Candidatus Margulisiibacteriota bacterium]
MKRYSAYKDSKTEYIGEIPNHWDTIRTRFVFDVVSGNGFPDELQGRQEGELPFYKCSDINTSGIYIDSANNYVDMSDVRINKWNIVPRNSILLAKIGEALKKNHRKISDCDCLVDNNMMAIIPDNGSAGLKYYYYLMCLIRMEWCCNPGAVPSVDTSKFRSFFIPKCSDEEQEQIGKFLDFKTVQIDGLIAKKEHMIELLKEERSAIINKAVTKGIDPHVGVKDSGVEWLGKVSRPWVIKKIKYNASVKFSSVNKKTEEGEVLVRLCNYVNVYYNDIISPELDFMEASATSEEIQNFQLRIGDVLVTKDSEDWMDIAIPAYVASELPNLICGYHLALIRPFSNLMNGKFLFYLLYANCINYQFKIEASGVTRYGLSNYALSNALIPIPSLKEQKDIAIFLDQKTEQIDLQIVREQKSIDLLKEFRTALISEVVTGKIDVRG